MLNVRRVWLPPATLLLPILWLFRKVLFAGEMFAFRDVAHFYYPLYQYVQTRWQSGLPLWNPLDGLGQPLLGDPSAAVLYPVKLVFLLPAPYALCFSLYITLHLWLAGYGAYLCARCFRAPIAGSLLAGLAYELSGHVLFQHCNPIYMVGAAWLPWSLMCMERMLVGGGIRSALLFGMVMGLAVLGGDPQMAYHSVIAACLRIAVGKASSNAGWSRSLGQCFGLLACACVVAVALSAAQILPSLEWAKWGDRSIRESPRSVWEWTGDLLRSGQWSTSTGMWRRNDSGGTHADRVYDFSVAPWRWSELVFPGVSGQLFPIYARWTQSFPGASRMWTPSLYLGLLPIALALYRGRVLGGSPRTRWISWLTVISALAALGQYGLGWLVNELRYQLTDDPFEPSTLLPGFGGAYWLFTVLLPGYVSFRYPSKWWTIASLGLSLLAAKGWPLLASAHRKWIVRRLGVVGLSALIVVLGGLTAAAMHSPVPPNAIFGPFDPQLARTQIGASIVHTIVVGLALYTVCRWKSPFRAAGLLLVTLIELTIAQQSLVITLDAEQWTREGQLAAPGTTFFRAGPELAYPQTWQTESSRDRFVELQKCDIFTLMPKHHLHDGLRSLRSSSPMSTGDLWGIWRAVQAQTGNEDVIDDDLLSLLGAARIVAPQTHYRLPIQTFTKAVPTNFVAFDNQNAYPRAWIVKRWEQLDEQSTDDLASLIQRTRDVLYAGDKLRDFRDVAIVESNTPLPRPSTQSVVTPDVCDMQTSDPERIRIAVDIGQPSLLVLRDQFYPGWQAHILQADKTDTLIPIVRVNRVFRGVWIEAGPCVVEFRYRPASAICGLWISGVTFVGVVIWLAAGVGLVRSGS